MGCLLATPWSRTCRQSQAVVPFQDSQVRSRESRLRGRGSRTLSFPSCSARRLLEPRSLRRVVCQSQCGGEVAWAPA